VIPVDKEMHFAGGLVLSGMAISSKEIKYPFITAVTVATAAGLAKEYADQKIGGDVDRRDVYFTVAGGVVSGTIGYLIKRRHKKKKREYLRHRWTYRHYTRY
jgi:VanZ family protein